MKRKKVVHIITKLELGGAQLNTLFTVDRLDKDIFDVSLWSGEGGLLTEKVRNASEDSGFSFSPIKDLVREISPVKDFKALFELIGRFRKLRPEIVHSHSSKAGILTRVASFLSFKDSVRIHSVHGFPFSDNQKVVKRIFYELIEKAGSIFTHHYIFVSRGDIEIAKNKGILKKGRNNFSLIRSGFDISLFRNSKPDKGKIRKRFGIGKDQFVVGVIAPFKPQKGLFHLTEIAEIVLREEKNTVFLIAGDGEEREEIEKRLEEKGIFGSFRLPGFIDDIEKVIPIFDMGVSTALWEGLPQSLVQIRLCGKAVVASDIPGNREVVLDGKNGYLEDPGDHPGFAKKIIRLIKDEKLRRRFSQFRQDFSQWDGEEMVRKQEKLYLDLLKKKGN